MSVQRRTHRLDRNLYKGRLIAAFTCCVSNKQVQFVDEEIFRVFEKKLLESLKKHDCEAHVYLFMPDHLHLLVEGRTDEADLWKCVVVFKQTTGYWLAQSGNKERWQHDFYDHILRKDEDIEKQVRYILENPVRAGLVNDWKAYRLKGSTMYDFSRWD